MLNLYTCQKFLFDWYVVKFSSMYLQSNSSAEFTGGAANAQAGHIKASRFSRSFHSSNTFLLICCHKKDIDSAVNLPQKEFYKQRKQLTTAP